MSAKSLFGQNDDQLIRKQAQNLLNDYGHPWDSLAEGVQNALDGINRRYRYELAQELGISEDDLIDAIETASDVVLKEDKKKHDTDYETWASSDYKEDARSRWYAALSDELGINQKDIADADEDVRNAYTGKLVIERITPNREIRIRDNGIGMSLEELDWAVLKGGSHKDGVSTGTSEIGELGNGLTYQICSCSDFRIETSDGSGVYEDQIENMYDWIQDVQGQHIKNQPQSGPQQISSSSSDRYTEVRMEGIRKVESDYTDIFADEMTSKRFLHLLRTKTAVGYLYDILDYPVFDTLRIDDIDVEFIDTTNGGSESYDESDGSKLKYHGPIQVAEEDSPTATTLLSRDKAQEWVNSNTNIGGSALYHRGVWESSSGIQLYYLAFISPRAWYRKASHSLGLCDDPSTPVEQLEEYDMHASVELAVKGMPTAVTVSPPSSDSIGYWANLHVVIMDNRLEFDEGRKSVVGRRKALYRECASDSFKKEISTSLIQKAVKDPVVQQNIQKLAKQKNKFINDHTSNRTDLNYSCLPGPFKFVNEPESEQDVVAIFHELIASGLLEYYSCLTASSYSTYDSIFEYSIPLDQVGSRIQLTENDDPIEETLVVEYKLKGEDLISDIDIHQKFYHHMDLLICWEIDSQKCQAQNGTLSKKNGPSIRYYGTTHELVLDPQVFDNIGTGKTLEVIELKTLLEQLSAGTYPL